MSMCLRDDDKEMTGQTCLRIGSMMPITDGYRPRSSCQYLTSSSLVFCVPTAMSYLPFSYSTQCTISTQHTLNDSRRLCSIISHITVYNILHHGYKGLRFATPCRCHIQCIGSEVYCALRYKYYLFLVTWRDYDLQHPVE